MEGGGRGREEQVPATQRRSEKNPEMIMKVSLFISSPLPLPLPLPSLPPLSVLFSHYTIMQDMEYNVYTYNQSQRLIVIPTIIITVVEYITGQLH